MSWTIILFKKELRLKEFVVEEKLPTIVWMGEKKVTWQDARDENNKEEEFYLYSIWVENRILESDLNLIPGITFSTRKTSLIEK